MRSRDQRAQRELMLSLTGASKYRVVRRAKVDVQVLQVSEGLRFNGIILLPSRFELLQVVREWQSRLK
jgi:hypothetical protein